MTIFSVGNHIWGGESEGKTPVEPLVIPRNCLNCELLSSDDSGDDCGSGSFPVCDRTYLKDDIGYDFTELRGFPFKEEMPCHVPNFWAYLELDPELSQIHDAEPDWQEKANKAYQRFCEKYPG